jgi:hypothetical protein
MADETRPYRYRMTLGGSVEDFNALVLSIGSMSGEVTGAGEWLLTVNMKAHVRPEELDRAAKDAGLTLKGRTTQLRVPGDHTILGTKHPR